MGFLNPLFLLAGLAIAIPLLIHLLHRQRIRDIIFPALIYLKRTEREHARRVKIRQLLVLLLRIAAILLLALAGARPFLSGAGSAHPPTALAIVLDNSASSGLVLEDERALDRLQAGALEAVRRANDQDRIWVLRAGEPWDVVVPLGREAALDRIAATEVSGGHADISAAVQRAVALVSTSDLGAHEVHVLSDLQKSGLPDTVLVQGDGTPILVWTPNWDVPWNGSVGSARVGGGLPPIQGQPTDVTSRVQRVPASNDSTSVRLWMGGEVRGAARASGDAEVVFPVPVVRDDHLSGFVERDPDQLVADDRHYFVAQASTAPSIVIDGNPGGFVLDALEVLEASGRLVRANVNGDVLVAVEGRGAAREPEARRARSSCFPPRTRSGCPGSTSASVAQAFLGKSKRTQLLGRGACSPTQNRAKVSPWRSPRSRSPAAISSSPPMAPQRKRTYWPGSKGVSRGWCSLRSGTRAISFCRRPLRWIGPTSL